MPGLRDRKEDIPLLVEHFLELAHKPGEPVRRFQGAAMRALMEHDWPGNVRELRHFLERTLLIAPESEIREEDLLFDAPRPWKADSTERRGDPVPKDGEDGRNAPDPPLPSRASSGLANPSLRDARSGFERDFLVQCLRASRGNVSVAARTCRISRESFYRLLRKYGLEPRKTRGEARR
jgi:DNA-binding NtrC family response regulator